MKNLIQLNEPLPGRRQFLKILGATAAAAILTSCAARYSVPSRPMGTMYETIAHDMLDMELEFGATPGDYIELDIIMNNALSAVGDVKRVDGEISREEGLRILGALDSEFRVERFSTHQNGLLHKALKFDRLDCDGYTIFYVAVGQLLSLPIDFVRAPDHAFPRLRLEDDHINWESTSGKEWSDERIIEHYKIPEEVIGKSFMRSLGVRWYRDEILANHYVNLGVHALNQGDDKLARLLFEEGVRLDDYYDFAHYNLGLVLEMHKEYQEAIYSHERAIKLNRNHAKPYFAIGKILHISGKVYDAIKWYGLALEKNPDYVNALKRMELAYNDVGDKRRSCEMLHRRVKADPSYFFKNPDIKPSTLCDM